MSIGGVSGYPTYNATFDAVQGPEVRVLGEVNFTDNVSLFPDNNTFQAGGHAVFSAQGNGSAIEVGNITESYSALYVRELPVPVVINHSSKQVIEISGDLGYLEYRDMEVDDGVRDFTYNGTEGLDSVVKIHGLPPDEEVHAYDMDTNESLGSANVSGGGVGEFVLPNSEHRVVLRRIPFLDVNITTVNATVIESNDFTITANVTNTGYAQGNQTTEMKSLSLGESDIESVSLSPGESTTVNLTGSTVMGDGGHDYAVNVSSEDSANETNLTVQLKPLTSALDPPLDLKGTGLHRDTDGNGLLDANDVQVFFDNRRSSETVDVHPSNFSFNGQPGISIGDVQSLWIHIFTPPTFKEVTSEIMEVNNGSVESVRFNVSTENDWSIGNLSVYNDFGRTDLVGYNEIDRDGEYFVNGTASSDSVFVQVEFVVPAGECLYTFLDGEGATKTYPVDSWETC